MRARRVMLTGLVAVLAMGTACSAVRRQTAPGSGTPATDASRPVAAPDSTAATSEAAPAEVRESLESVSVALSDDEQVRLFEQARNDLARVAEVTRALAGMTLPEEKADRRQVLERLVASARDALADDDPAAAASLSRKARLLAEELIDE